MKTNHTFLSISIALYPVCTKKSSLVFMYQSYLKKKQFQHEIKSHVVFCLYPFHYSVSTHSKSLLDYVVLYTESHSDPIEQLVR